MPNALSIVEFNNLRFIIIEFDHERERVQLMEWPWEATEVAVKHYWFSEVNWKEHKPLYGISMNKLRTSKVLYEWN